MDRPRLTALLPYFGGKRTMATEIVAELGPHTAYWEPFCGSLAVLFAKPRSSHETVNDLHGDVVNLALVVASPLWESLYAAAARTLYCETLFREAQERFIADEPRPAASAAEVTPAHVDRALTFLVVSWIGRNGVSGTARPNYQMAIRWTPGGGHGGTRWRAAVDALPWWHQRLSRAVILRRDAFDIIPRIHDTAGVAIYADPPYILETRGNGGGSRYQHDFGAADHVRLAEQLRAFRAARIVVSYYDHPRLAELYPGWTFRRLYRQKNLHVQNRRGAGECTAPEVLLINGPSMSVG